MKGETLRKKHPQFVYQGYNYKLTKEGLHISFDFFVTPNIHFYPSIVIQGVTKKDITKIGEKALNNLVFHLGLAEIPSYWKATCSPKIIIQAGYLSKEQITWFKNLILKGMGEFFFQNNINFTKKDFVTISSANPKERTENLSLFKSAADLKRLSSKILVPVGGGKDAIVTLELLKKNKESITPFILNPKKEQLDICKLVKLKPIITKRTIDPTLLKLNRAGYLNGHTPFSAYLAFLSTTVAALLGFTYIAVSNERSSNEGNIKYLGTMVNHQWSKTYEFEKQFRQYAKKYLGNTEYFSFLRPLYELQIAKLFAQYPQYFSVFLSCNEANKTQSGRKPAFANPPAKRAGATAGTWCGQCAKCLFVFLALYPFVGEKKTVQIFKKNLLQDKKLIPLLQELTGKKKYKPFECVGTIAESKAALLLQNTKDHPMLHTWNSKHFLPFTYQQILKKSLKH